MVPGDIPALSLAELTALAQTLKAIAQRNRDTELAGVAAGLFTIAGAIAARLTTEPQEFTLTPREYAMRHNASVRTIQHQCQNGKLPAIRNGRTWRIKA